MFRLVVLATSLGLLMSSCAAHTAGRKYTVAKVNSDRRSLVEAKSVLPARDDGYDRRIDHDEYIGLTLNGGFLRFLNDAERPEVAIFARVRITPPDAPDETHVVEGVYLHSEQDDDVQMEGNSFFPRLDIPLMPGLKYEGQDIQVQLRVIEIDGDDRERVKTLINSAASAAAIFAPESASTISVFQTVLSFLNEQNRDDIEFQFDFGLSESKQTMVHQWQPDRDAAPLEDHYDLVFQPRVATYVVIKTEQPERLDISGNYFDVAHSGLRYTAAQLLKVGTLGLFNWSIWSNLLNADREDDFYLAVMGRPFGIPRSSWVLPKWHTGQLSVQQHGQGMFGKLFELHALSLENNELVATPGLFEPCDPISARSGPKPLFADQSYMIISVTKPERGVDLTKLRTLEAWKRTLEFETKQLSTEEFAAQVGEISDALIAVAKKRAGKKAQEEEQRSAEAQRRALERIEATTRRALEAANNAEELDAAKAGHEARLAASKLPNEMREASRRRFAVLFMQRAKELRLDPTPYAWVRLAGAPFVVIPSSGDVDVKFEVVLPAGIDAQFQRRFQSEALEALTPTEVIKLDDRDLYRFASKLKANDPAVVMRVVALDEAANSLGSPMRRVFLRGFALTGATLENVPLLKADAKWAPDRPLVLEGTNLSWTDPITGEVLPLVGEARVRVRVSGEAPQELELAPVIEVLERAGSKVLALRHTLEGAVEVVGIELQASESLEVEPKRVSWNVSSTPEPAPPEDE